MLLVLGTANTIAFADEKLLYNQNGVIVRYERSGEMDPNKDKARPVRSGGEDGKAHLDSLRIFDQSTYADKLPNHFYYRTVGYQIALLNEDKLPIDEDGLIPSNLSGIPIGDDIAVDPSVIMAYLLGLIDDPNLGIEFNIRGLINTNYFRTKEIREKESQAMKDLIKNRFGEAGYNKPYVTSFTISRERLIKELGLEGREHILDQAKYLLWAGEIEYFKSNPDCSEGPALDATRTKIMYNPARKRLASNFNVPPRYESLRGDIETRMQLIDLQSGEVTPIKPEVLPDLIVGKIEPGAAETKPGAKHTGKVTVRREVETENTGPLNTTLYLTIANGKIEGQYDIPVTLNPGETKEIQFTWEAGADRSKNVLIVAEINPAKLGQDRLAEKTYDNNKKSVVVHMEQEKVDLSAIISEYMDALFINETETFASIIKNTSSKQITTDVVWRVAGKQVRKVTVTIPANGHITDKAKITMPNTNSNILVEVEVNPSRNKPADEVTWSNNKDSVTISNLGVDDEPQTGESDPYLVD